MIEIYCDGACSVNPGIGGWGAVVVLLDESTGDRDVIEELCGAEGDTTNNRMELMGAIRGLATCDGSEPVRIVSDSAYVVNCFRKGWLDKWKTNGWVNSKKKAVMNRDLWEELDLLNQRFRPEWSLVKGHSGNIFNEKADELAVEARLAIEKE